MHSLKVASDCCASSGGATDGATDEATDGATGRAADRPEMLSTTSQLYPTARRVADWSGPPGTVGRREVALPGAR